MNPSPRKYTCALSPCPNDTFIFHALSGAPDLELHFADVETLNRRAFDRRYDITKLSFHAWLLVREDYRLLPVGAALGRGCGPLLVRRVEDETDGVLPENARVAVPGYYTTAHLLLHLWTPRPIRCRFIPYDAVMDAVAKGEVDAGVIIHEGRFVYERRGLSSLCDLGAWWEEKTGLPLPLGCFAARRELSAEWTDAFVRRLRDAIRTAHADPAAALPFVRKHAQELDAETLRRHIATYVNDFTLDLGEEGRAAVERLEQEARRVLPLPEAPPEN